MRNFILLLLVVFSSLVSAQKFSEEQDILSLSEYARLADAELDKLGDVFKAADKIHGGHLGAIIVARVRFVKTRKPYGSQRFGLYKLVSAVHVYRQGAFMVFSSLKEDQRPKYASFKEIRRQKEFSVLLLSDESRSVPEWLWGPAKIFRYYDEPIYKGKTLFTRSVK